MAHKKGSKRLRIALFTSDDIVWALPTWKKTIPVLKDEHDFIGVYLFPDRLANLKGLQIPLWYLRVFGLKSFIILGCFGLKQRVLTQFSSVRSWKELAQRYGLQLHKALTPNSDEVVNWVRENEIDIIFINVGNILKESIILAPKIGIINKHAAILPGCRGIFPYFWGKLTGAPTGFTFHSVDTGIDTGKILLQRRYPTDDANISLLRFYIDVFNLFPKMVNLVISNLVSGKIIDPPAGVTPSYYSLPTSQDHADFFKAGFRISRLSDLFYSPPETVKIEEADEIRRD